MGIHVKTMLFWGAAYDEQDRSPWADSMDQGPHPDKAEPWHERLKRRLAESGQGNPLCLVGTYRDLKSPMYYAAIAESVQTGGDDKAGTVEFPEPKPDWEERLKRFCQIMDMPMREAGWRAAVLTTEE